MAVGTVGTITNGKQANELLEEGLDLAIVGRMFQKNPGLVWTFAEDLGVQINVANQIRWVSCRPLSPYYCNALTIFRVSVAALALPRRKRSKVTASCRDFGKSWIMNTSRWMGRIIFRKRLRKIDVHMI